MNKLEKLVIVLENNITNPSTIPASATAMAEIVDAIRSDESTSSDKVLDNTRVYFAQKVETALRNPEVKALLDSTLPEDDDSRDNMVVTLGTYLAVSYLIHDIQNA
ncbi:MAG: hypothetical protein H9W81_13635 [Enterococcus sp.]|nr:hypothetical protein [Enterococcus sp.]